MSALTGFDLDDRHKAFIEFVIRDGLDTAVASERAGFHPQYGYTILKKPAVVATIHQMIQTDLVTVAAPAAFRVAKSLMLDEKVSPRVRADISFKFMDRAGHITPASKEGKQQKALSEMTRDEMLHFIETNQAQIDRIEAELAERATDVSAPRNAPDPALIDAKALSFLD